MINFTIPDGFNSVVFTIVGNEGTDGILTNISAVVTSGDGVVTSEGAGFRIVESVAGDTVVSVSATNSVGTVLPLDINFTKDVIVVPNPVTSLIAIFGTPENV